MQQIQIINALADYLLSHFMQRLIRHFLSGLFLLLAYGPAGANVSVIEAKGGLPDKFITSITKDRQGLMWIGTRQGLCTYDGYDFVPVDVPQLNNIPVSKLVYDRDHDLLWAATENGLYKIQCHTRKVWLADKSKPWCKHAVTNIEAAAKGKLYVSFKSGEIAFSDAEKGLTFIKSYPDKNPDLRGVNLKAGYATLYVQTGKELRSLKLVHDTLLQSAVQHAVPSLITICGDTMVTELGGLKLLHGNTFTDITPPGINKKRNIYNLTTAHFDAGHILYLLCRPSVIYRINTKEATISQINSEAFTGRLSTCMFFDEQHIIWVGTNKGLLKITPDKSPFEHTLSATPTISVRPLVKDESGFLYAGTYSGLYKTDANGLNWRHTQDYIPYIIQNMPGNYLYLAGEQKELHRLNKKTGNLENTFYDQSQLPEEGLRYTFAVHSGEDGTLWLGGLYGLLVYDPVKNRFSSCKDIKWPDGKPEVRCIRSAGGGNMWVCTNKGLYLLDDGLNIAWHISTHTKPALSLNIVNHVEADRQGKLWICTAGGGINIVSRNRQSVSLLKTEEGLSDNTTYNMLWDNKGIAWISTYNGLSTYDTARKLFYNYYVTEDQGSNEFNHNAFLQDSSGKMYFGTINGLISFYPDSVARNTKPGLLFASTITKWDNNTQSISFIPSADTGLPIILNPLDHSLSFNLAMNDYTNPENNLYRYRIKGLFDDWIFLSGRHELRLDGLAPGTYFLEIRAMDSRGIPAMNLLRYKIVVLQPFYKAWWFYLLLFLLASGLIWSFFYLRLRHIRRMQTLRAQIASDLHDEVGSLLTRITMTSDNLLYTKQPDQPTTSGLKKIAKLSRTAVSSMSDILWTIDARNDYTGNLADRMREHAEEMLWPTGAGLHFDLQIAPKISLPPALRQQLYFIFKEAVNNIVKHSHPTSVSILYHHSENGFELIIENDGRSAKHTTSSQGQGLKNMNMRAKRVHAKAEITHENDHFKIRITGK